MSTSNTYYPANSQEARRLEQLRIYGDKHREKNVKRSKTDLDVLVEQHQFIRKEKNSGKLSYEQELAERWYSKLFREFALIDLKHYKSGQIAMRWRTEQEVIDELGERTCGSLRCEDHHPASEQEMERWKRKNDKRQRRDRSVSPDRRQGYRRGERHSRYEDSEDEDSPLVPAELTPYQLKFAYQEFGEDLEALVKVILCKKCGKKLNKGRQASQAESEKG